MNMPYQHDDPLERTVAADNYDPVTRESENACPVWMRITAVNRMPWRERQTYMSAEPRLAGLKAKHVACNTYDKSKTAKHNIRIRNRAVTWVRVDEIHFRQYSSLNLCCEMSDLLPQSARDGKRKAKISGSGFFMLCGKELWIVNPAEVVEGAIVEVVG